MNAQPGLIVLLGSGETAASIRRVYHWLFKQLDSSIHIGILETPAGFEPNSDMVARQIADFMEKRLQNFRPRISVIPARKRGTSFSPNNRSLIEPLLEANVIMMGPGSPTYVVRQLQDSLAWHTLNARHRLGACLIFASAATIACSAYALPVYEIYKVGKDLHWQPGLSLLKPFGLALVFIPHWNNNDGGTELDTSRCYLGKSRYDQLVKFLPNDITIVGIDEHTALVIDPTAKTFQILGVGNVILARHGKEQIFPNGGIFDITELGPFASLPDPKIGIPTQIWEWVLDAQTRAQQAEKLESAPPAEVLSLLEERDDARAQKDWALADELRSQIEGMGWRVLDTSQGSRLEPV